VQREYVQNEMLFSVCGGEVLFSRGSVAAFFFFVGV